MAAYPSFAQLMGSSEEILDDVQVDRAVNGSVKSRAFYSAKKRRFTLKHVLDNTDVNTLLSFYDSYRLSSNTFTWARDSTSYTVLFEAPPSVKALARGYNEVEVRLVQQ